MNVYQQIENRRAEILRIAEDHGARNLRLIGSVARGDVHDGSDLDLLVEFESGRTLMDHAALMLALQSLLGLKVDVASERGLRPRVRSRVLAEARPL